VPAPDPEHVDRWLRQFVPSVQEPMLVEMDHVLKQSYLSQDCFRTFLRDLAGRGPLIGGNTFWATLRAALRGLIGFASRRAAPQGTCPSHWRNVHCLEIQKHGASQREMVRLLKQVLAQEYGWEPAPNGSTGGPF